MKQVEVTILGQTYLLACPEGGQARLAMAVSAVDREMSTIRDAGKIKARERIAVLAALNIAYQHAERLVAEPASGSGLAAASASLAPRTAAAEALEGTEPQLTALLQRLDEALAGDGRLF